MRNFQVLTEHLANKTGKRHSQLEEKTSLSHTEGNRWKPAQSICPLGNQHSPRQHRFLLRPHATPQDNPHMRYNLRSWYISRHYKGYNR